MRFQFSGVVFIKQLETLKELKNKKVKKKKMMEGKGFVNEKCT